MREFKASSTAVVTVMLHVSLAQPWAPEATLGAIHEQAKREALERVGRAAEQLAKAGIAVGAVHAVRLMLAEEKL